MYFIVAETLQDLHPVKHLSAIWFWCNHVAINKFCWRNSLYMNTKNMQFTYNTVQRLLSYEPL